MDTSPIDKSFARYIEKRNPADLAQVFDLAAPQLYRLSLHLCGSAADAEDVLQATFLAAIESAETWKKGRGVLPWITGILTNRARSLRGRRRRQATHLTTNPIANEPSPLEIADDKEILSSVIEEVDRLPGLERRVVILNCWYGMKPAEIAHALDDSPSAIRVRLHRALKKLKHRLPTDVVLPTVFLALAVPGLANVRRIVLAKASAITPASTTFTVAGVALMSSSQKAVLLGVVLIACSLYFFSNLDWSEDEHLSGRDLAETTRGTRSPNRSPSEHSRLLLPDLTETPAGHTTKKGVSESGTIGFEVLAIDKITGKPMPGTEIYIHQASNEDHSPIDLYRRRFADRDDPWGRVSEDDLHQMTGPRGRAVFPALTEFVTIFAFSPGRSAIAFPQTYQVQPFRVELVKDLSLKIEVVNAAGQRQSGIPVRIGFDLSLNRRSAFWRSHTRDDGSVELKHLQRYAYLGNRALTIELGFPQLDPVRVPFDLKNPPEDPIRLVLPNATARLEVEIRDEKNEICHDVGFIGIGKSTSAGRPPRGATSSFDWQEMVHGRAFFDRIGVDSGFDVVANFMGKRRSSIIQAVKGPMRPGGVSKIVLICGPKHPRFRCVLVDAEKRPIASSQIHVRRRDGRRLPLHKSAQVVRSDAQGVCDIILHDEFPEFGLKNLAISARVKNSKIRGPIGPGKDLRELMAVIDVSGFAPYDNPTMNLGTIVLEEVGQVVAGRVVDEAGNPLAGIDVVIERQDGSQWLRESRHLVRSDRQGRFSIRGDFEPGNLRLNKGRWGDSKIVVKQPTRFERGDEDVILVIKKKAGISGSLLLPQGIDGRAILVWLTGSALDQETAGIVGHGKIDVAVDGGFHAGNLQSGTVSVAVHLHASNPQRPCGIPLVKIENLQIVAGEVNCDRRLQQIDLRDKVRVSTVFVVDESHTPIRSASVLSRSIAVDRGGWQESRTDMEGRVRIMRGQDYLVVRAGKSGFAEARLSGVSEAATLTLSQSAHIRVHIDEKLDPIRTPTKSLIQVRPMTTREQRQQISSGEFEANDFYLIGSIFSESLGDRRTISIPISGLGKFEVEIRLFKSNARGQAQSSVMRREFSVTSLNTDVHVYLEGLNKALRLARERLR